jgi:hypothetical protein
VKDIVSYSVIERSSRLGAMSRAGADPEAMHAAVPAEEHRVRGEAPAPQERILEGEGLAEPIAATELSAEPPCR